MSSHLCLRACEACVTSLLRVEVHLQMKSNMVTKEKRVCGYGEFRKPVAKI